MHRVHEDITLGRRLQTRRIGDLAVHEVRYRAGWSVPSHAHAHANVTFICQGAMEETAHGQARLLRACDAVIKPVGTVHSNRCGADGARTLVIEFPDESFLSRERAAEGPIGYATLHGPETIRAALRAAALLGAAPERVCEDLQELVIETLAMLPTGRDGETTSHAPRWLMTVQSLLHDGFAQPIRVRELAGAVDLHPVYLARAFRRRHGCSITNYRRRLQVSEAAQRLAGSDEDLASVALRSGFTDQSHLCRAFRGAIGVSPGAFRRLMRCR